jgi:hypothetical protein
VKGRRRQIFGGVKSFHRWTAPPSIHPEGDPTARVLGYGRDFEDTLQPRLKY